MIPVQSSQDFLVDWPDKIHSRCPSLRAYTVTCNCRYSIVSKIAFSFTHLQIVGHISSYLYLIILPSHLLFLLHSLRHRISLETEYHLNRKSHSWLSCIQLVFNVIIFFFFFFLCLSFIIPCLILLHLLIFHSIYLTLRSWSRAHDELLHLTIAFCGSEIGAYCKLTNFFQVSLFLSPIDSVDGQHLRTWWNCAPNGEQLDAHPVLTSVEIFIDRFRSKFSIFFFLLSLRSAFLL